MSRPFVPSEAAIGFYFGLENYDLRRRLENAEEPEDIINAKLLEFEQQTQDDKTFLPKRLERNLYVALRGASERIRLGQTDEQPNGNVFIDENRMFSPAVLAHWNYQHLQYMSGDSSANTMMKVRAGIPVELHALPQIRPLYDALTRQVATDAYKWSRSGTIELDYCFLKPQGEVILLEPRIGRPIRFMRVVPKGRGRLITD